MSPNATPATVTPTKPLRMQYDVDMSPATTTSGRIFIRVTSPEVPRVACDSIIIDVPIGIKDGDVFTRTPRIESNSVNWSPSGQESIVVPDKDGNVSKYYRFTIQNQTLSGLVPLLPFELIITGNVNTQNMRTNEAKLVLAERSVLAEGDATFPDKVPYQEKSFSLAKYESFLLYINSFYSTDPDSPTLPKARFANGEAINLSWESNGHIFELYQEGRKIYEGESSSYLVIKRDAEGNALDARGAIIEAVDAKGAIIKRKDGMPLSDAELPNMKDKLIVGVISADTTFVLKAIGSSNSSIKPTLYETLTVTVSNPSLTPKDVNVQGKVGVGTSTPATSLDVRSNDSSAAITVGTKVNGGSGGALYLGNPSHGLRRGFPDLDSNNNVGFFTTAGNLYLSGSGAITTQFVLTNAGNVGIGNVTPDAKLHVDGAVKITGRNTLEFGGGVPGKEVNAGKIGYGTFDDGASLNIVGAGGPGWNNRKITFWNEGGATFHGGVGINVNGEIRIEGSKPIIIQRFLGLGDDARKNTGVSIDKYAAAITGMVANGGDIDEGGPSRAIIDCRMYINYSTRTWHIRADFKTHITGESWDIDVMFIDRRMADVVGF